MGASSRWLWLGLWLGSVGPSCGQETQLAPWPELSPDAPTFVLEVTAHRVDEILGPLDPTALAPIRELELDDEAALWMVQPSALGLGARHPLTPSSLIRELGLHMRNSEICAGARYDLADARLSVPLGDEARWFELDESSTFASANAPEVARQLEWSWTTSEVDCGSEFAALRPFGPEPRLVAPELLDPTTSTSTWFQDFHAVSRVDVDHVVVAASRAAYLLERGRWLESFEGPWALPVERLVPVPRVGLIVRFSDAVYVSEPSPRVVFSVAELDPVGSAIYGWLFEVELGEDGFGGTTQVSEGPLYGTLVALDESSYLGVAFQHVVLREGERPPRERRLATRLDLQRVEVSKDGARITVGGSAGFLWTGTRTELMEDELERAPIEIDGRTVGVMSAITGIAEVESEPGEQTIWASTFNSGLLVRGENGTWTRGVVEIIPRARDCLGSGDACGFLRAIHRHRLTVRTPSEGMLLVGESCPDLVEWRPALGCSRRVLRMDDGPPISSARHEGTFFTLVAAEGIVLELEYQP